MGQMRVLNETGDTVVEWAVEDAAATGRAERLFGEFMDVRWMAFARAAGQPAAETTLVRTFDPEAEEIIIARPLQGG